MILVRTDHPCWRVGRHSLVIVIGSDALQGERKLPGQRYLMESLSSSIPELLNITHGKSFLPDGAYPREESWCYLYVFHWSSNVRWRWDRFHTRVRIVKWAWVATTMSHCARRLRTTLPEARSGWCLSALGKPPGTFDRGLGSLPRVDGRGSKGR
jgi:hypothetical protein